MIKNALLVFLIGLPFLLKAKKIIERPTDQLKLVYHVEDENQKIKNGLYQEYFELKLRVKGQYSKNKREGNWQRFFASGETQVEANYFEGKKNGQWKYYYENGSLRAIINFSRDLKIGTWESFSTEGKKLAVYNYQSDSLFGEQVLYHHNGEIAEYKEIFIEGGNKYIKISRYYENTKLFEEFTLFQNQKVGRYRKYHPSGIIWEDFEYENNQLIRVNAMKNPKGKSLYKSDFREGDGELRRYHGNGKLYAIERYRASQKFGKAQFFDDDILRIEGFYYHHIPMGTWKYFSVYGKLLQEKNFFGAKDYHYVVEYGVSGEERYEGEALFGEKTGNWKAYNFYGDLLFTKDYKFGFEHGTYKRFDGTLLLEKGGYFYGEKVGRWQTFNKSQKVVFEEVYSKSVSFDTTTVIRKPISETFGPKSSYTFEKEISTVTFPGILVFEDQYLTEQIKEPEEATKVGIKGTVICYLEIDEFGETTSTKIQRGIGFGCDDEVKRVLNLLPNYGPAFLHGIPQKIVEVKEFSFGNDS